MTSSDIIALVAVIVSGLISIATIISNFLVNRANILAKRDEMMFIEQLKVCSSIAQQVTDIESQCSHLSGLYVEEQTQLTGKNELTIKQIQEIGNRISDLLKSTVHSRIYLPAHIFNGVTEYVQTVSNALIPQATLEERIRNIDTCKPNIQFIDDMRKFMGVKED